MPWRCDLLDRLLAPAEDEAGALAVEVEAGGEVDGERELPGKPAVLRREVHPAGLAAHGDVDPGEGADVPRPHSRRADDRARADRPGGRLDADDLVPGDLDAVERRALQDAGAMRRGRARA